MQTRMLILFCLILLTASEPARAQGPLWPQQFSASVRQDEIRRVGLLNAIDQEWDRAYGKLKENQFLHKANNGRYFQGLGTHRVPPGQAAKYPDRWLDRPSDNAYRWEDIGLVYEPMVYSIEIVTYDGPNGSGWLACIRTQDSGLTMERCDGYGPEVRDHGWAQVVSEP
jgi:hypothetical protein